MGNPNSLGIEGADKDIRGTGYTPPCSPAGGGSHEYSIWVYALDGPLANLPTEDSITTSWSDVMDALGGHVLNAASIHLPIRFTPGSYIKKYGLCLLQGPLPPNLTT
jgi:phosphatidylethanolamine-binding protein (PEBP) family uncharacterized protein